MALYRAVVFQPSVMYSFLILVARFREAFILPIYPNCLPRDGVPIT